MYSIGLKIPKRDRFGIHAKIESMCLDALILAIKGSYLPKQDKKITLEELRTNIETLKNLFRLGNELTIYSDKTYWLIQVELQEISKMTNGWIKYITQNPLK